MDIKELIARLEAASAGSEELDVQVLANIVGGEAMESPFNGRWCVYSGTDRRGKPRFWEPRSASETELWRAVVEFRGPTRSIDAALKLVPEGMSWRLCNLPSGAGICSLGTPESVVVDAETPALAVCIAALRARGGP